LALIYALLDAFIDMSRTKQHLKNKYMESADNNLATPPTEDACQDAGAHQPVVTNEFEKPPGFGASVLTSLAPCSLLMFQHFPRSLCPHCARVCWTWKRPDSIAESAIGRCATRICG